MRKILSILLIALCMLPLTARAEQPNVSTADTTSQTAKNIAIYNRVYDRLKADRDLPLRELVVKVALEFVGTDYLWASLESVPEELHVYLDKTDCILFVEMSTCFALTIKGKRIVQAGDGLHYPACLREDNEGPSLVDAEPSYQLLVDNIRQMRYRLGEVKTYASRIHYTSEWLLQNRTNGIVYEYTSELGEPFTQTFSYMSDHPTVYYQLRDNMAERALIREMEQRLDTCGPYCYISQERLRDPKVISQIHSGDIITFISPRPGLDLAHVAIAYETQGEMHFIHASYGKKKVVIEEKTLADYATNGIRISRLTARADESHRQATFYVHQGEHVNDALEKARRATREGVDSCLILIHPGDYIEELTIDVPNVTLRNASPKPSIRVYDGGTRIDENAVRLTWYYGHGYQYGSMGNRFNYGGKRERRWNASTLVTAPGFRAEYIIFENSFNLYVSPKEVQDTMVDINRIMPTRPKTPYSTEVQLRFYRERASALSFTSEAKHCVLHKCRVIGRQDALYGDHGAELYVDSSTLCGAVDYIFGGLTMVADRCELVGMCGPEKGDRCYIAAGRGAAADHCAGVDSIPQDEVVTRGMLFKECTVRHATANELANPGTEPIYLARPWRWWGEIIFDGTKAEPGVLSDERCSLGLTKGHPTPYFVERNTTIHPSNSSNASVASTEK